MGDDRESPSEELIHLLKHNKARVTIVDPYINESVLGTIEKDVYNALENADAMVLMTAHDEFKNLDFVKIRKIMRIPILVDGRRVYDYGKLKLRGFYFTGVGCKQK